MTARQSQYIAFIRDYTRLNRRPPSEADMQRHFQVTPPTVHQMVLGLEKHRLITRVPGQARSIHVIADVEQHSKLIPSKPTPTAKSQPIFGRWRITSMEMWDQDFVDAEVPGYFEFEPGGRGTFQFGYVGGSIDFEPPDPDDPSRIFWSWDGHDEMDQAAGSGTAGLLSDGSLKGRISIHRGDKSGFTATKIEPHPSPADAKPHRTWQAL